ncbi:MAG: hypothetical protein WA476_09625, partial [Acidobacteriaceae bacterium]
FDAGTRDSMNSSTAWTSESISNLFPVTAPPFCPVQTDESTILMPVHVPTNKPLPRQNSWRGFMLKLVF